MEDALDKPVESLIKNLPQTGKLVWVGVRPERKAPLKRLNEVRITEDEGLVGDHFSATNKKRQVTLIQQEHLDGVAGMLGKSSIDPVQTRRNLVVQGINLLALRNERFRIGDVVLEGTGYCHPCSRMEENLGDGGYNAMRGHGGITAKVISGGIITLGDEVKKAE